MGVLRADVAHEQRRSVMMTEVRNQDGVPLKDWKNSPSFVEKLDRSNLFDPQSGTGEPKAWPVVLIVAAAFAVAIAIDVWGPAP